MENRKSSGLFGRLFASKPQNCCSVQIEEIEDSAIDQEAIISEEAATVGESRKTSSDGPDKTTGCCSA
ncbi:hypothetical protein ACFOET_20225 [Parapedobacter deserti]|uniref:CCGSCS motif protein n=1 Tax=Parapedobacter deserti TaxID=1912957 RepID=A0ABV7JUN3_9SPHI